MVESSREKEGKLSHETRFYLSRLSVSAAMFNRMVRNHRSIENKLPWRLNVIFCEGCTIGYVGNTCISVCR
jgi:predicted transposase YbfD/YdcC